MSSWPRQKNEINCGLASRCSWILRLVRLLLLLRAVRGQSEPSQGSSGGSSGEGLEQGVPLGTRHPPQPPTHSVRPEVGVRSTDGGWLVTNSSCSSAGALLRSEPNGGRRVLCQPGAPPWPEAALDTAVPRSRLRSPVPMSWLRSALWPVRSRPLPCAVECHWLLHCSVRLLLRAAAWQLVAAQAQASAFAEKSAGVGGAKVFYFSGRLARPTKFINGT